MVQEYIWRSEQEPTKYNPMSTLIVSFYENLRKTECGQRKEKPNIYNAHINRSGM
jgi:hypothetical protein